MLNKDLNIEFANFASPGLRVEDLIGTNVLQYLEDEFPQRIGAILKNVIKTGETGRYETTYRTPDGDVIYYESVVIPRKSDEDIVGLTVSARDITQQKISEEEKKQLEDQLRQAQKMEAIGTLAGGIAHDFNNILAIITGNLELAMEDLPHGSPVGESLHEVQKAAFRARDVVKQILSFSRKSEVAKETFDLKPVVTESLKLLRASIPTTIEFRRDISEAMCPILGDRTQIHQVLMNLCANAAHAMEAEGGIMTVGLRIVDGEMEDEAFGLVPGQYVKLSVNDTGMGIRQEVQKRIFDPYFTTKEVGKGTGMGLAVVHGIVMAHEGHIFVDSHLGKGTVFHTYFPAVLTRHNTYSDERAALPTGHERVLYVDDEPSLARMGKLMLEKLGYGVESLTNPVTALEFFASHEEEIDLVITDMTMPQMTGDQLTRKLLEIKPDIPIIITTGFSERISQKNAHETGAMAFAEKPLSMRRLAETLRKVLDER